MVPIQEIDWSPSEEIPHEEVDGDPGPEEMLDRRQLGRGIEGALMALKVEYRSVVVLKHLLDCSYEEMGEMLGLPEKTVKSRLFTARQLLREALLARGMERP